MTFFDNALCKITSLWADGMYLSDMNAYAYNA